MKNKKTHVLSLMLLVMVTLFVGCSGSNDGLAVHDESVSNNELIVGTWFTEDENLRITFFDDGKLTTQSGSRSEHTGSYSITDGRIRVVDETYAPLDTEVFTYEYEFYSDGNILVFTTSEGDIEVYFREGHLPE